MTERPLLSYLEVLAIADLPALLAATILSRLAGGMLSLAIVLYALTRFASPALAGWLSFAAVAPGLLISPLAGALLDRIGSTRAITVDMAASGALVVDRGRSVWFGQPTYPPGVGRVVLADESPQRRGHSNIAAPLRAVGGA